MPAQLYGIHSLPAFWRVRKPGFSGQSHHPETGDPIRRVIVGGMGFITGKSANSKPAVSRPTHGGCGFHLNTADMSFFSPVTRQSQFERTLSV